MASPRGAEDAGQAVDSGIDAAAFRLAVDRSFTLPGIGTVATGTAHAGRVRVGDELLLVPAGRRVRVRSLHAQNAAAESAQAGQRCALALAGIAKDEVQRGDWLCAPGADSVTQRADGRLHWWSGEAAALRPGTPVHVHLGTADVMASVALLDRDSIPPGESGLVQLVLRRPVGAWRGDRAVLRDASASRTVGGWTVLDPAAPVRLRRTPERLARLAAAEQASLADRLAATLEAAPHGVDAAALARAEGWLGDPLARPWPSDAVRRGAAAAPAVVGAAAWSALRQGVVAALQALHASQPDDIGPDTRRLRRMAGARVPETVWRHLLAALVGDGTLAQSGPWLHLPEHGQRLSAAERRIAEALAPHLAEGDFDPPWVRDLARLTTTPEAVVRQTLAQMARRGEVFQVVRDLYYPAATVERLATLARRHAADGRLPAAAFRDATGLGRKRAIQLLEFFDRIGYTRRVKDAHLLRPDTSMFAAGAQAPPG